MRKFLALALVFAMLFAMVIPALAADGDPIPTDFAYYNDSTINFHCSIYPDNGGANQTNKKEFNYTKGSPETLGQIEQGLWALLKQVGEIDGVPVYTIDTDYVCPECGSSRWVSYSNNGDSVGNPFPGGQMNVCHYGTGGGGTVNLSGEVNFRKDKFVDGGYVPSAQGEFKFNLYKINDNGTTTGPLNEDPIETDPLGVIDFELTEEFIRDNDIHVGDHFKFVEVPDANWEIEDQYKDGMFFTLGMLSGSEHVVALWDDVDVGELLVVNNNPANGSLTVSVDITKEHDVVDFAKEWAQDYSKEWAQDYSKEWAIDYSKEWAQDYAKEWAQDYAKEWAQDYAKEWAQDYSKEWAQDFAKEWAQDYAKEWAQDFAKEWAQDYAKEWAQDYAKEWAQDYAKEWAQDFAKEWAQDFAKEWAQDFAKEWAQDFAKEWAQDYAKEWAQDFYKVFAPAFEKKTASGPSGSVVSIIDMKNGQNASKAWGTNEKGYAWNNNHTFVKVDIAKLLEEESMTFEMCIANKDQTPLAVFPIQNLTYTVSLVKAGTIAPKANPSNNNKDKGPAATATMDKDSGAVTVKVGNDTIGTTAFVKNGSVTVTGNGYKVKVEFNGNGVKSATVTEAPSPDDSSGGSSDGIQAYNIKITLDDRIISGNFGADVWTDKAPTNENNPASPKGASYSGGQSFFANAAAKGGGTDPIIVTSDDTAYIYFKADNGSNIKFYTTGLYEFVGWSLKEKMPDGDKYLTGKEFNVGNKYETGKTFDVEGEYVNKTFDSGTAYETGKTFDSGTAYETGKTFPIESTRRTVSDKYDVNFTLVVTDEDGNEKYNGSIANNNSISIPDLAPGDYTAVLSGDDFEDTKTVTVYANTPETIKFVGTVKGAPAIGDYREEYDTLVKGEYNPDDDTLVTGNYNPDDDTLVTGKYRNEYDTTIKGQYQSGEDTIIEGNPITEKEVYFGNDDPDDPVNEEFGQYTPDKTW